MIIAGTGHRTQVLLQGKTSEWKFCEDRLLALATTTIKNLKPKKIISGMALGWDTAIVRAALVLKIPFIAAVPFENQDGYWTSECKKEYQEYLKLAEEVVIVTQPEPVLGAERCRAYIARDEWMVDNCDLVLALLNPKKRKKSGTGKTVDYAEEIGKSVKNLWDSWVKFSGVE